jgi:paraquat-inducible protein B
MDHVRGSTAALIGFFFLLAFSLLLVAVVFLSTGLKSSKNDAFFILCFDSSLNGLEVGAPVKFRGVRVGSVEKISVSYDPEQSVAQTPIIIKTDPDFLDCCRDREKKGQHDTLVSRETAQSQANFYQAQIAKGLSAKLSTDSFLTGKLFIELDYYSDRRTRQLLPIFHIEGEKKLPQIPTVYSDIDRFMQQVEHINLPLLLDHLENCLSHLDEKIQKVDMDMIMKAVQAFSQFSRSADEIAQSETLKQGLAAIRDTFVQGSQTFKTWNENFPDLKAATQRLVKHISNAISDIQTNITSVLDEDSPLQQEILKALKAFSDMIFKLQSLIEYLERNPNAILAGKQA